MALPQGDNDWHRQIENILLTHSQFTPTGIFVTKGSKVIIQFPKVDDNKFSIFIGQWGDYANLNHGQSLSPKEYQLTPETNIIISETEGMLYLSNKTEDKSFQVQVNVEAGINVPTFKVDETSNQNFLEQLQQWSETLFVEIIGKNVFGTFQMSLAKELWLKNDPNTYNINYTVQNWDKVYEMSNHISGLDFNYDGVALKHHNLIQIANPDSGVGYAFATNNYIGFQQDTNAGKDLFQYKSLNDWWALWHEIGHTYQNPGYKFDGFTEVTVNINSFSIQEQLGFKNRVFASPDVVNAIKNFIKSPNPNKSIESLDDWGKLGLFLQLHMAYGKSFFPSLNQMYRLLNPEQKPKSNEQKYQLFIEMTSKLVNRNLTPFFEKWGIKVSDNTKKIVSQYHNLTVKIWNNIFDGHIENNAIVDYILPDYQVVNGPKVDSTVPIRNLRFGQSVTAQLAQKYITNMSADMTFDTLSQVDWRNTNYSSNNSYFAINVNQPNKIGNKYIIPNKLILDSSVKILGLGNDFHGILNLDVTNQKLFFVGIGSEIHLYFKDEKYVGIQVYDDNNQLIYDKSVNGDENTLKFEDLNNFTYHNNYQIHFWFAEPGVRGQYFSNGNWKQTKQKLNKFIIKENNLVKI
ncbi:M60 family metallopeptidase [Spiroplasma endosymbiont of Nebria brevicollis]|uniref:M60 family metallopeptidase n=1 Tax=Spiroplasma endosymbiont of Nebria brevicollis TaxID=3066284 RepID=UPI00313D5A47